MSEMAKHSQGYKPDHSHIEDIEGELLISGETLKALIKGGSATYRIPRNILLTVKLEELDKYDKRDIWDLAREGEWWG